MDRHFSCRTPVLVSGGGRSPGPSPLDQENAEIFAPPYLFKGPRPTISSAPTQLTHNGVFQVQTPDVARIAKVSLVAVGNMTHGINMNQRYLPFSFSAGAGSLTVTAPSNANLAPPGVYMLFLVDNLGVPSLAAFVPVLKRPTISFLPPVSHPANLRNVRLVALVREKWGHLRWLAMMVRSTTNWKTIWQSRRGQLPSLRLRNGLVLHHGPSDSPIPILKEVFVERWYEIGVYPPARATMLDIGANIGSVSLFWSQKSPTLQIHAYEPNPAAFETLQRNVAGNQLQSRMAVFPEAVGRSTGTLRLWIDVPTDLSTGYLETSPREGGRRIPVPQISLDEAWRRIDSEPIWLLKIDTEGAEVDILEGASRELLDAVQHAIVETHDNIYPGAFNRCRRVLETAGLTCRARMHPWNEAIVYAKRM